MAFPGPGAGGNFLEQILADLLQVMGGSSAGGVRTDLARTLAQAVASGGEPERNVDPADRMKFEELARIAELHVAELTGLRLTSTGATIDIAAMSPGAWALQTVEDWRFLLEAMTEPSEPETATTGTPGPGGGEAPGRSKGTLGYVDTSAGDDMPADFDPGFDPGIEPGIEPSEQGPADLLARYMATMGPMLAAMQLGSAIGHLARSTMGAYDLPIPRPGPRLLVVPANVTRFAEDWSLTPDEVRLWVCLRELTAHAVLSRPHVAQRLQELLVRVVLGSAEDTSGLVDQLQGFDLTQPESLQNLLGDPTALMSLEQSPARRRAAEDLLAVMTALLGYVEHILDLAATRLLGGRGAIAEAWRRRQVDRESAERAAELLLGLDLGPAQIDRGHAFVRGVFERAGDAGLARLWSSRHTLPTPAEIDAPGLWLERIDLPDPETDAEG